MARAGASVELVPVGPGAVNFNSMSVLTPVLVAVGLTATALALRRLLLKRLGTRGQQRESESVELLREGLRFPSLLWCIALGLYGGMEAVTLPIRLASRLEILLQAIVIVSVTATAANLLAALVARFGESLALAVAVTGLAHTIVRGTVLTIGGMIFLGSLGIAITPILTALGIGGLTVAVALQDALSNLFAGIHLLADKIIRVGEFVKLDTGVEGFVEDIGWRSTRIRALPNGAEVVVPNVKIAQGIVTKLPPPPAQNVTQHSGQRESVGPVPTKSSV